MKPQELARKADTAGLRLVRFLWCGNDGTIRAKASSRRGLEARLVRGIGVTRAMQAMNSLDQLQPVEGFGPVGEFRLVPDLDSFRVAPYLPNTGLLVTDHTLPDGTPAGVCQRTFLKRMQEQLGTHGVQLRAAFENEFSLARKIDGDYLPVDTGLCFSTISAAKSSEYVDALVAALEAQRIPLEQYYSELGHGQQEISTAHAPAVQAADEQLLVRETIRGVATKPAIKGEGGKPDKPGLDLVASLAPKPWAANAGNGMHVHFSLWDGETNRFYAEDGLSPLAQAFLAGVLAHLPGLCGLTAPSFQSYKRIAPGMWAGAYTCWGHDNREAPVRVPSAFLGDEEASTNVELKASDATSNPYLALGGIIAAGLDGIERELTLPDAVDVDPATLSDAERAARGIRPLPANQAAALDALAADEVLMNALGDELSRSYLAVRRSEWATYSTEDEEFEHQGHFEKY